MKKLLFSVLFSVIFLGFTQAQFITTDQPSKPVKVVKPAATDKATSTFYLDYDYAEELMGVGTYTRYIWDFNMNATALDSTMLKCGVAFKEMFDYNTMMYVEDITSLHVDSIFAFVGHENNSGTPDTFIVKIFPLATSGAVTATGTPLWSDTVITTTGLSTGNDWMQTTMLGFEPNLDLVAKSFGVILEYHGDAADSCGFIAGFSDAGTGCGSMEVFCLKSQFYPNSFVMYSHWTSYGLLPQYSSGTWLDVYYDCDGVDGYIEGVDSEVFTQNICISSKVTVSTNTSISENAMVGMLNAQPNPATDNTVISYNLKQNAGSVYFNLYDMAGRLIISENLDNQAGAAKYTLNCNDLNTGIYYYSIVADGVTASKKLVVE
ncbi:MAG: hypothetical protein A2W93_13195 [Bacteroidetes bacterium GWF2_43_63]|nr:MAG: hypothetical protein A2W93_13195 [Bacteroidetes bacterium GWF2_43_63]HBG70242.1 hypothetical protein [Bacteroidales bacterium]